MNKENASKLWKMIQEAGHYLPSLYLVYKELPPTVVVGRSAPQTK